MAIRQVDSAIGVEVARDAHAAAAHTRQNQNSVRPVANADPNAAHNSASQPEPQHPAAPPPPAPSMRVHVDQDTGKTVVSIVDPANGQVLRQMPSAEALEVAKAIGKFQGMFIDLKV